MSAAVINAVDQSLGAIVDLARYPLHTPESAEYGALIARCKASMAEIGSFNLDGFLRPEVLTTCVAELEGLMAGAAYRHSQTHNIYFSTDDPPLPQAHGARTRLTSSNYTLTCDQLAGTSLRRVYEWQAMPRFLGDIFDAKRLYPMRDPLARLNVMGYGAGEALNWHFDRAQFTVTLLLQSAESGGIFQYRRNLRTDADANYEGVARLLNGEDAHVSELQLAPGTLNVFAGRYAAHRITPVAGERMRLISVLSYMDAPDVVFSDEDRMRFYGRTGESSD